MIHLKKSFKLRLIILLPILSCSFLGYTQSTYSEFEREKSIERKIEIALELRSYFIRNDIDSLLVLSSYMDSSKRLSRSETASAVRQSCIGSYHVRTGAFWVGMNQLKKSRQYFLRTKNFRELSRIDNEIGNGYLVNGIYYQGAKYFASSLDYGQKSTEETAHFNGMIGLGKIFCAVGDTIQGIRLISIFLSNCLGLNKFESAADASSYLGMLYEAVGDMEMMEVYYRRGIVYAEESNSKSLQSSRFNNEAILKFISGDLDSSIILFRNALALRLEFGQKKSIIESYFNIGGFYLETGVLDSSEVNFIKSLKISEQAGFLPDQYDALSSLKEIYLIEGKREAEISALDVEMKRIAGIIANHSEIDSDIYKVASEFEESIRSQFESKPKSLWTIGNLGTLCLVVLISLLYWKNRS